MAWVYVATCEECEPATGDRKFASRAERDSWALGHWLDTDHDVARRAEAGPDPAEEAG